MRLSIARPVDATHAIDASRVSNQGLFVFRAKVTEGSDVWTHYT